MAFPLEEHSAPEAMLWNAIIDVDVSRVRGEREEWKRQGWVRGRREKVKRKKKRK